MKTLQEFISEANNHFSGSSFSQEAKYSKADWEKWKKATKDDVFIGNYESDPDLEVVYISDHGNKMMKHIATYNTKTQVLWCDDIHFFGNEIK